MSLNTSTVENWLYRNVFRRDCFVLSSFPCLFSFCYIVFVLFFPHPVYYYALVFIVEIFSDVRALEENEICFEINRLYVDIFYWLSLAQKHCLWKNLKIDLEKYWWIFAVTLKRPRSSTNTTPKSRPSLWKSERFASLAKIISGSHSSLFVVFLPR